MHVINLIELNKVSFCLNLLLFLYVVIMPTINVLLLGYTGVGKSLFLHRDVLQQEVPKEVTQICQFHEFHSGGTDFYVCDTSGLANHQRLLWAAVKDVKFHHVFIFVQPDPVFEETGEEEWLRVAIFLAPDATLHTIKTVTNKFAPQPKGHEVDLRGSTASARALATRFKALQSPEPAPCAPTTICLGNAQYDRNEFVTALVKMHSAGTSTQCFTDLMKDVVDYMFWDCADYCQASKVCSIKFSDFPMRLHMEEFGAVPAAIQGHVLFQVMSAVKDLKRKNHAVSVVGLWERGRSFTIDGTTYSVEFDEHYHLYVLAQQARNQAILDILQEAAHQGMTLHTALKM